MNVLLLATIFTLQTSSAEVNREPRPYAVAPVLQDVAEIQSPSAIHIGGWLGERIRVNESNRLLNVDMEPLLAGFIKKPGTHPWIGEHVGKWMHAATLAWSYSGDAKLRAKLDKVAAALIATQEPDGYLGTYVPGKRFGLYPDADWDVWSHKYNLIGLLTYYQFTGNKPALDACRKMGDLLINTFGPGKKSILSAGTHMGMAATSVLEPITLLYRATGDERYLGFAKYIVNEWEAPGGPKILTTLLTVKHVNETANGKAYEMLSNLVGLCELARATGDKEMLQATQNAWEDITTKRLYLTGSASRGEHFGPDYDLPNQMGASIAETCVTTTWIQLNLELLRLTGEAKYANEIEKATYNHLAAAQNPLGDDWCYYTPLQGKKPYDAGITCCHSSGPRGMALAPLSGYLKESKDGEDTLLVSTFEPSAATLNMGGNLVNINQASAFPFKGDSKLSFKVSKPSKFSIRIRIAPWATSLKIEVNGNRIERNQKDGWLLIPSQLWTSKSRVHLTYSMGSQLVVGDHVNNGKVALQWGPFVMAYDAKHNIGLPVPGRVAVTGILPTRLGLDHGMLTLPTSAELGGGDHGSLATFVPFADAGANGGNYSVWVYSPGTKLDDQYSVLASGHESRSRPGNSDGTIADDSVDSNVVTFDNKKQDEDWYAITLDKPVEIGRIVMIAGQLFHDGGWFDTSTAKPIVEVQRQFGGPWE